MPVTTIGTLETPYQICQDMYSKLADIQRVLQQHSRTVKPGEKVMAGEKIIGSIEVISSEVDKFNDAFFSQLYRDAQRIAALAKKDPQAVKDAKAMLKRIERIFRLIKKAHREHMKREHFFVSFSHKLAHLTKRLTKGVEKLERQQERAKRHHERVIDQQVKGLPLPHKEKKRIGMMIRSSLAKKRG